MVYIELMSSIMPAGTVLLSGDAQSKIAKPCNVARVCLVIHGVGSFLLRGGGGSRC